MSRRLNAMVSPLISTSSESSPLLSQKFNSVSSNTNHQCCSLKKHLCLPSKGAALILAWTAVISFVYYTVVGTILLIFGVNSIREKDVSNLASIPFAILALLMMFYPLSGFIADVYCGRFRTTMASLIIVTISFFILFCTSLLLSLFYYKLVSPGVLGHSLLVGIRWLNYLLLSIAMLIFMIGLIGYQANFILLGLDQLLEAPSEYLGLFIHWAKWITNATATVAIPLYSLIFACNVFDINGGIKTHFEIIYFSIFAVINAVCCIAMITLLILSYCKFHWFYSEPGQHNPYKTVLKILNYVRTHKYPLQRSAFTYCDYIRPSRFDFAKERFGGPFTTEQVEDVKSFLRIILILLALGPVYVLQVPASSIIVFPLFGLHTGHHLFNYSDAAQAERVECNWKQFLLRSNNTIWVIATLIFPIYIWFIFSFLRKRMPRILIRLGLGTVLLFLGVVSMLVIDVVGHATIHFNMESLNNTGAHTQCMFHARSQYGYFHYPTLNLHWSVLIPPNILLGIGPLLVETTTLEFISAQSPHSMKGFLVGIFFAIKGLFQFLGSITIIPFSLNHPSSKEHQIPSFISCGFLYLLFTCVVGLIGMILFFVAATRYKNRERDEVSFRQRDVEEIYDRYLTQVATPSASYSDGQSGE